MNDVAAVSSYPSSGGVVRVNAYAAMFVAAVANVSNASMGGVLNSINSGRMVR